jgi:[acyl-carrier-protein] S-malonyltransferase
MAEAAEELRTEIRKVEWGEMSFPVISNVTARELDCEELEQRLVEQLYRPVRWQQSIEYMSSRVDYFIEAGPGRTLSGLVKKTSRHHLIGSVEDPGTLAQVMKKLGEAGRPGNNPENKS